MPFFFFFFQYLGLTYFQLELQHIGVSLPVLITETGWALNPGGGEPTCTEQQKADYTVVCTTQVHALAPLWAHFLLLGRLQWNMVDKQLCHWSDAFHVSGFILGRSDWICICAYQRSAATGVYLCACASLPAWLWTMLILECILNEM